MMLMNYDFELRFAKCCNVVTFSITGESYDDAVSQVVAALDAAGVESLRREGDITSKHQVITSEKNALLGYRVKDNAGIHRFCWLEDILNAIPVHADPSYDPRPVLRRQIKRMKRL